MFIAAFLIRRENILIAIFKNVRIFHTIEVKEGAKEVEKGAKEVEVGTREVEEGAREVEEGAKGVEEGAKRVEEVKKWKMCYIPELFL